MSVFLVTWDLNRAKPNYNEARDKLIAHLSKYPHIKDAGLDSVWFINSNSSAEVVAADVRTKMDDNDRLIVTKLVSGQHQGWLDPDVWIWINARL